jgi:hypothetical protein
LQGVVGAGRLRLIGDVNDRHCSAPPLSPR